MGSEIKVGDIMAKDVISVSKNATVKEITELMEKHDIGSIVVTVGKKAEGIVTERDVVHRVIAKGMDANKTKAGEVMSSPLQVITPDANLETAAKAMRDHKIKRLPVINERKELVGILSEGDIMRIFPSVVDVLEERVRVEGY